MAVGSTPRDSGNIPLGCVLVPGDTTPQALQGGAEFTDANGNISAPARVEVTQGSKATYVASGTVWQAKYLYVIAASGNPSVLTIDFNQMGQSGTLRGVAQQLA